MGALNRTPEQAREEFPTLERWHHFDSARKAPLPRCAEREMASFMQDIYETGGSEAFDLETVEACRQSLANFAGTSADQLAFVKNTSEGLNAVAHGLGLSAGDNVVVTELEHPANVLPWRRLAAKGVELRVVKAADGRLPISRFEPLIDARTRVVATSWVTYGCGLRVDIGALSQLSRERAILVVDGIQGMGLLDQDLDELGADILVSGVHKGLLGLTGTGFIYLSKEMLDRIEPLFTGHFSFQGHDPWSTKLVFSEGARRFEYGNPNFLGLRVLKASLSLLKSVGRETIDARIKTLTSHLIGRAREAGLEIDTPMDWPHRAGIVSFCVSDPETVRDALRNRGFLVSTKDGRWLRTSCHFFNSIEEVDALVETLADCLHRREEQELGESN